MFILIFIIYLYYHYNYIIIIFAIIIAIIPFILLKILYKNWLVQNFFQVKLHIGLIIDSASSSFRLKLKETPHITQLKPSLNKQKEHVSITI